MLFLIANAALPAIGAVIARVLLKLSVQGAKNFQAFLAGRSNSRINPIIVLAAMAYVYDRSFNGCANRPAPCNPLTAWQGPLTNVMLRIFGEIGLKGGFTDPEWLAI